MTHDQVRAFVRLSARGFGPLNMYDWGLMRDMGIINEQNEIDSKRYAEVWDAQFTLPVDGFYSMADYVPDELPPGVEITCGHTDENGRLVRT